MTNYFLQAFVYLCSAVIVVPLAQRFKLGSVLGYLIAGIIIGPVIGIVGQETTQIQHFAEFGVVMMLFLVGLELEPKMLWNMKHRLLGLGGLQMLLTVSAVTAVGFYLFHQYLSVALSIGLILSLSSTAIVLQTLNEKGLTKTSGGKNAFSVLLFQDIAVIPILALLPILSLPELATQAHSLANKIATNTNNDEINFIAQLPGWMYTIVIIIAMSSLAIAGHYLSTPLFRYVAESKIREIFTATALMLVIGIAALMSMINLSPALGTFLAGVVLANSEFKHELEANIEPFKGLLLGLFFITVGASVDFNILWHHFGTVILVTLGIILIKGVVLLLLSFIFKIKYSDRWLFSLSLAQAGEFGFVLLSFAVSNHILTQELSQILSLVIALSMFLTPGLFILFDKISISKFKESTSNRSDDQIDEQGTVIIAGIGRFGQIVNRMLKANRISTVVLDSQSSQVELMKKIAVKSYFGDPNRPELLITAGIEHAKLLVIAIDNKEKALELVQHVKRYFSHIKILARAYDQTHYYLLKQAGADFIVNETYYSALNLGTEVLKELGIPAIRAERIKRTFSKIDKENKELLFESWLKSSDGNRFSGNYRDLFLQLEDVMSDKMEQEESLI